MTWVKNAHGVSVWQGPIPLTPIGLDDPPKPKKKSGRPRTAVCGTDGGYNRHCKDGTRICAPCREAHAECSRERRQKVSS